MKRLSHISAILCTIGVIAMAILICYDIFIDKEADNTALYLIGLAIFSGGMGINYHQRKKQ